jgi:hypothetical protein
MSEAAAAAPAAGGPGAAAPSGAAPAAVAAPAVAEGAVVAPKVSARSANPPLEGAASQIAQRPDWAEEKHWDADKGTLKAEELGKAYKEAVGKLSTRKDDLLAAAKAERAAGKPADATGYKLDLPAAYKPPEGVTVKFQDSDVAITHMREIANEQGWSQVEFSASLQKFAEKIVAGLPTQAQEMAALGERATDRIKAVKLWGEKTLGKNDYQLLLGRNPTARHVEAFERLMGLGGDPRVSRPGGNVNQNGSAVKTLAELRAMQQDPRYADASKREKTFVAQVDAEYQRAYAGQKQTAPLNPKGR